MHQSKCMCLFFFSTLLPNCRGSQEKKTFSCFCLTNETNEMVKKNWWIIYHDDDRWTSILKIIIMIIMIQCSSSSSSSSWSFYLDCPKTGNAHRFIHLISKVWNEGMKNRKFFSLFFFFIIHPVMNFHFQWIIWKKNRKKKKFHSSIRSMIQIHIFDIIIHSLCWNGLIPFGLTIFLFCWWVFDPISILFSIYL